MQANNNLALTATKKNIVQTKTQKPQITKRKTNYFKFVISEQFESLVMFWLELVQFEVWMLKLKTRQRRWLKWNSLKARQNSGFFKCFFFSANSFSRKKCKNYVYTNCTMCAYSSVAQYGQTGKVHIKNHWRKSKSTLQQKKSWLTLFEHQAFSIIQHQSAPISNNHNP